ncbi:MAG: DMT family transporter [Rhodospirillales bacterium]|nr:DMT family transporter [Rhodospirillales bacterium]
MPLYKADPALVFVFLATCALAFKGVLTKLAYTDGLDVNSLLLIRFGLAAPLFWVGVRYLTGGWTGNMRLRDWRDCFILGCLFFMATYSDFMALSLIDVSLSRLILFTFPAQIVIFTSIRDRRPPSGRQMFSFLITYSGLVFIIAPDGFENLPVNDIKGIYWAMISATSYAAYLMASQRVMKRIGSARFTAASGSMTLGLMLVAISFTGGFEALEFTTAGFGWGALIAIACTVIPFFLLFEGIARSNASKASMISLLGPVITIFFAWIVLGEYLTPTQLFGCVLAMIGIGSIEGVLKVPKKGMAA